MTLQKGGNWLKGSPNCQYTACIRRRILKEHAQSRTRRNCGRPSTILEAIFKWSEFTASMAKPLTTHTRLGIGYGGGFLSSGVPLIDAASARLAIGHVWIWNRKPKTDAAAKVAEQPRVTNALL